MKTVGAELMRHGEGHGNVRVSVIIPVYNAANRLSHCLRSLEAQTLRDFEVIAVNDGSTDGSLAMLRAWLDRLRLRIVEQRNSGAAAARNAALALASGEYVYMLDADDFIHPRLLECAVDAIESHRADFALFDFKKVEPADCDRVCAEFQSDRTEPRILPIAESPLKWFVGKNLLPTTWRFLFRRTSLAGMAFRERIIYEDNVFIYAYLSRGKRGVYLPKCLYAYVQDPSSVMHTASAAVRFRSMDVVMRAIRSRVDDPTWRWLFRNHYLVAFKTMWRDREEVQLARELTAGWFRDMIVRHRDISPRWWLKLLWYNAWG